MLYVGFFVVSAAVLLVGLLGFLGVSLRGVAGGGVCRGVGVGWGVAGLGLVLGVPVAVGSVLWVVAAPGWVVAALGAFVVVSAIVGWLVAHRGFWGVSVGVSDGVWVDRGVLLGLGVVLLVGWAWFLDVAGVGVVVSYGLTRL